MNTVNIKQSMRVKRKPRTKAVKPALCFYSLTNIPSSTEFAVYWPKYSISNRIGRLLAKIFHLLQNWQVTGQNIPSPTELAGYWPKYSISNRIGNVTGQNIPSPTELAGYWPKYSISYRIGRLLAKIFHLQQNWQVTGQNIPFPTELAGYWPNYSIYNRIGRLLAKIFNLQQNWQVTGQNIPSPTELAGYWPNTNEENLYAGQENHQHTENCLGIDWAARLRCVLHPLWVNEGVFGTDRKNPRDHNIKNNSGIYISASPIILL